MYLYVLLQTTFDRVLVYNNLIIIFSSCKDCDFDISGLHITGIFS